MSTQLPNQDDRVTAALAHLAAILPFWGIVASLIIWLTQKEKSQFVAFHALQSLVYQILPILGGLALFLCYICSFSTMFLLPFAGVAVAEGSGEEWPVILMSIVSVGVPFVIFGVGILLWLAWLAYALYGAVRVFQGHDFRYALVGRWIERYQGNQQEAV